MARTMDITDKLSFESNPELVIKGKHLEVNADAPTLLKVMGMMGKETPDIEDVNKAYEMMFPEKSRKDVEKLGLKFSDWMVLVQEAIALVTGGGEGQGEQ